MAEARLEDKDYASLSVLVPVFNERSTVAEAIRRVRAVDVGLDVEVIVVDDGSEDGTDKVLAATTTPNGPSAAPTTPATRPTGRGSSTRSSVTRHWSSTAAVSPGSARTCSRCTGWATGSCRS